MKRSGGFFRAFGRICPPRDYACMPLYYYTNPNLVNPKLKGYVSTSMADKLLMWAYIEE